MIVDNVVWVEYRKDNLDRSNSLCLMSRTKKGPVTKDTNHVNDVKRSEVASVARAYHFHPLDSDSRSSISTFSQTSSFSSAQPH